MYLYFWTFNNNLTFFQFSKRCGFVKKSEWQSLSILLHLALKKKCSEIERKRRMEKEWGWTRDGLECRNAQCATKRDTLKKVWPSFKNFVQWKRFFYKTLLTTMVIFFRTLNLFHGVKKFWVKRLPTFFFLSFVSLHIVQPLLSVKSFNFNTETAIKDLKYPH